MKKIFLLLFLFVLAKTGYCQFPITQYLGSDSAIVKSRGGLQGRFAPIPFTDTAQANTSRISQYPGALIYTSGVDKYWYRNSSATGWIEFTSSGGATVNIYNSNGTLTSDRQVDGGGVDLRFNDLKEFGVGADSSVFTLTSGIFRINALNIVDDTSTYKPLGYDSFSGKIVRRTSWIGGNSSIDTISLSNRINTKADSSNVWFKTGNGGIDTTKFIGTNDLNPIIFKINNIQAGYITARPGLTSQSSGSLTLGQFAGQTLRWNNGANTLLGHGAGANIIYNPSKENQNTMVGLWAGYWTKYHSDPFGGRNVMVGQSAGFKNYNGSSLTYLGTFAGEANNQGNSNTGVGRDAIRSNIDGNYNTGVGWSSLLNNTTGVKTISVTNGGSGYTSATVTISNPPGPTPGVLWEAATATATISGGAIVGITVTNPGAGYSLLYGERDIHDTIRVTITGDGAGAKAEVTETISNVGNTGLGYGSGYLDRFGKYNISIGYLATMNNQLGEDMILLGSNSSTGTLSTTPIVNGIAIGKNSRVSRSNTMALGGMGSDTINVGINTDTARKKLDVVGGDILVHEHTIGRGPGSIATNTVFGTNIARSSTTAFGNTLMGYEVAANGTVSSANVLIGYRAANTASYAGTGNIIVGYEAAYLNRANESVAIGLRSMYTQGSNGSVGIGAYTLYNNVRNTSIGRAMNTAIGDYSYYSLQGSSSYQTNTGVGAYSGYGITNGAYNTSIGALSMGKGWSGIGTAGSSGNFNTSLGYASLYYQNNSSGNIGIGSGAFNGATFNPSIGYNIGIGFNAGNAMGIGDYNVLIGGYSGSSHSNVSRHIIFSDGEGSIRFTSDSVGNTSFYGTGGHKFQSGTTAQRPTNVSGTIRWNTDSSAFEYADGSLWYKFGTSTGGGVSTIASINGTTKSANGAVISGSNLYMQTVDGTYPGLMTSAQKARLDSNSYLTIDKRYDSLAWRRNDSTFLVKSLRLQLNGSTITPTTTDSSLSYNILTTDTTTVPLITFSAGAGFAADTTLVTDSTLMGSLYTGQYEFTITKIQAVIKGNSGDSVVLMIVYNDSFNVLGTKVTNAGLSVSSRVFGNTFDVYTNRTVPANQWLWIKPQAVIAGKKPKYISVTLLGYKTYVAP